MNDTKRLVELIAGLRKITCGPPETPALDALIAGDIIDQLRAAGYPMHRSKVPYRP
jgi:hypothetical protein